MHIFDVNYCPGKTTAAEAIMDTANSGPREEGGNGLSTTNGIGLKYSLKLKTCSVVFLPGDSCMFELTEVGPFVSSVSEYPVTFPLRRLLPLVYSECSRAKRPESTFSNAEHRPT